MLESFLPLHSKNESSLHTYSELKGDRIRLLLLLPGIAGEPIKCQMKEVSLSELPRYSAVSYTWGLPEDGLSNISLDGHHFRVRRNLLLALNSLRLPGGIRALWVDAICINQRNIRERNHQVGMMGRIYVQAECVLACIGEANEYTDRAMETLREFDETKATENTSGTMDWGADNANRRDRLTAVEMLCNLRYWERTWILQEVLLAKELEIICGGYSVSWSAFAALTEEFTRHRFDSLSPHYVPSSGDERQDSPQTYMGYDITVLNQTTAFRVLDYKLRCHSFASLPAVLELFASKCKDPRDKVYAVLALIDPSSAVRSLVVDYGKSLKQLYLDVMKRCQDDYARDISSDLFKANSEFEKFGNLLAEALEVAPPRPSLREQELKSMASKRIIPRVCRVDQYNKGFGPR
jgi:hypothetical protein